MLGVACGSTTMIPLRRLFAGDVSWSVLALARRGAGTVPTVRVSSSSTTDRNGSQNAGKPREVCASMRQVKTSPMKLNLVAKLIRGMSVNDALAQVKFCEKKASKFVETTLLDAQRRAEQTLDLDPLNLHVVESFVGKGSYLKRIRYHGRGQFGVMHKYYAHYYLKLREGPAPPKKKRAKTDHKSFVTRKLILAGPRSIPNSL